MATKQVNLISPELPKIHGLDNHIICDVTLATDKVQEGVLRWQQKELPERTESGYPDPFPHVACDYNFSWAN